MGMPARRGCRGILVSRGLRIAKGASARAWSPAPLSFSDREAGRCLTCVGGRRTKREKAARGLREVEAERAARACGASTLLIIPAVVER